MGRSPGCEKKLGLKKGPWTVEEDQKLMAFIDQHGHGSWSVLPAKAGLERCGKSCRLRWNNYLRPDIKRGKVSSQEEQTIVQLHALLGNRWSTIAAYLPNRTDNEIKNYWNTHLKKRLTKMGIDPVTHKPTTGTLCATANLSHMAQWESARLQAEARLVREAKRFSSNNTHKTTHTVAPPPPCLDVLRAWQLLQLAKPPLGGDHHMTAGTTSGVQNGTMMHRIDDHGVTNINIPILPFNNVDDMPFLDGTSNIAWYEDNENENENENDAVLKHAADVFSDFNSVGENHGTAVTGHHGTAFFGEEDKNDHWSNILMNLVTINASANSASTSPSGAVF